MSQLIVRPVQGALQDGTLITVQGSTPGHCNGFSINLSCGPGDIGTSDVVLHLNPRFNENAMVRNTFQNGAWGSEDRSGGGMPFQKGTGFECMILVQNDKFMISFNGRHFCEFRHRLPKERVTHVIVKGDVQVSNVMFSGGSMGGYGGQPAYGGQPGGYGGQQGGYGGQSGGYPQQPGGYPQSGYGYPH